MSLDRIPGEHNLFIGSLFATGRPALLAQHNITHILSVLSYTPTELQAHKDHAIPGVTRAYVPVDDVEDEDLLMHFPRIVRFIDSGLAARRPDASPPTAAPASRDASTDDDGGGGVYVHCAMGKSRSAAAVVAFLLWKYPVRFGRRSAGAVASPPPPPPPPSEGVPPRDDAAAADEAVQQALAVVREARPMVQPNPGFMQQLALWWRMGCPAETDDAVERHPIYQRWLYQNDVEASTRSGRAPERLWFGDEAQTAAAAAPAAAAASGADRPVQLRCKICRRVLAASPFVLPHNTNPRGGGGGNGNGCAHYFVEPLSWMRPVLEQGALDGRLVCPNPKCGTSIGRYSWQGFKCTCREWVCPAFSLQKSKVDQVSAVATAEGGAASSSAPDGGVTPFSIRLPPGARGPSKAENL